MNNSKLKRAMYGPSMLEITLGLLLSVALGAALGIVFLVFKPVETVKELPKVDERKFGMVYFVTGANDYSKSKFWMRKQLLEGKPGEIVFSEDDLNAWFASSSEGKAAADRVATEAPAKPAAKPAQAKPAGAPAEAPGAIASEEIIIPSVLNFRIRDNAVQVGMPTTLNLLGYQFPVTAQARGGFKKQGDMFIYSPDVVMIGSLPLHRFPGATEYLMQRALASKALPEEFLATWKKITSVAIDGKTLRLTIQ
jgi:hypothetical protein